VAEIEERRVGDMTLRIDRSRCIGFASCSEETPEAFGRDQDDLVSFKKPSGSDGNAC
jgi:ferredoxin